MPVNVTELAREVHRFELQNATKKPNGGLVAPTSEYMVAGLERIVIELQILLPQITAQQRETNRLLQRIDRRLAVDKKLPRGRTKR